MSEIKREDLNFILQRADVKELENLYNNIKNQYEVKILQAPTQQTLLQPIYDPISKGEFYAGEILVTSTIVSVGGSSHKGWAMVQDDNEKLSLYISVLDASFEANIFKKEIEELVTSTVQKIQTMQKELNKKVNATKVSFDLM